MLPTREHERRFHQIEQIPEIKPAGKTVQPAPQDSARRRCRENPAGFIGRHDAGTFEQGANAPCDQAVEGNNGNLLATLAEPEPHLSLGSKCLGFQAGCAVQPQAIDDRTWHFRTGQNRCPVAHGQSGLAVCGPRCREKTRPSRCVIGSSAYLKVSHRRSQAISVDKSLFGGDQRRQADQVHRLRGRSGKQGQLQLVGSDRVEWTIARLNRRTPEFVHQSCFQLQTFAGPGLVCGFKRLFELTERFRQGDFEPGKLGKKPGQFAGKRPQIGRIKPLAAAQCREQGRLADNLGCRLELGGLLCCPGCKRGDLGQQNRTARLNAQDPCQFPRSTQVGHNDNGPREVGGRCTQVMPQPARQRFGGAVRAYPHPSQTRFSHARLAGCSCQRSSKSRLPGLSFQSSASSGASFFSVILGQAFASSALISRKSRWSSGTSSSA